MAERKNPKLDVQHQAILKRMMQLPENKECADCKGPYPRWASTNLGIFVCMTCSGIHRKLGTHISQVRSITLDTWTPSQIAHFQKLGNAKAANYFEACMPPDYTRPHSSDSHRMEAFIRDKYETRRFITVENGGLGGASSSTRATQPQPYSLHSMHQHNNNPRPFQTRVTRPYDDGARPASSQSYAARFSHNGAHHAPAATSRPSASSSSTGMRHDAVARATTVKEIVNMGFPTQLALRAVEATNGDLQRAIDWVLQNSTSASGVPGGTTTAAKGRTAAVPNKRVEPDLLDFGADDDEVAAPAPSRPAAALSSSVSASMPSKPPSHVADFADFGEFESALPATGKGVTRSANLAPTANATASPPPTGALSASLADLYKKPAVKATSPSGMSINSSGGAMPHAMKPLQLSKTSTSFSNKVQTTTGRAHVRPAGRVSSPRADASALGLPVFDFQTSNSPAAKTKTTTTTTATTASAPSGVRTGNGRPEPPPMQEAALQSTDAPPPPSPPAQAPKLGNGVSDSGAAAVDDTPSADTESTEKEQVVVEEEEDPFAALSMMALSSASGRSKRKTVPVVSVSANAKDLNATGASITGDSFVDDLLG